MLIQVIYTSAIGFLNGAVYLRTRNLWGVILMHTLTDITAFIAVFDTGFTGMDIVFSIAGSLLFTAWAFYLIRPVKHEEIETLWEEEWSFGNEDENQNSTAKAAALLILVPVILLILCLWLVVFYVKAGLVNYDIPVTQTGLHSIMLCVQNMSSHFF